MSEDRDDGASDARIAGMAVLTQVAFGSAFVLAGLGVMAMVHFSPGGLRAPYWVVAVAMLTFVVAGLSIIARALGWRRLAKGVALLVVFGLAVPGLWMLFDPADQVCTATIGTLTRAGDALECRIVFGIGGAITLLAGIVGVAMFVRRLLRRRSSPAPRQPDTPPR